MMIMMTITLSQWNVYDHYNPGWMKKAVSLWGDMTSILQMFVDISVNTAFACLHFILQHLHFLPRFLFISSIKKEIYEIVPVSMKRFLRKKTIHESMRGWYISFIASIYWSSKTVIGELKSKSDTLDLQVTPNMHLTIRPSKMTFQMIGLEYLVLSMSAIFCNLIWCENTKHC